ncbi:hypothetical protein NUW54_g11927 [Trametes sanguinea]|uniref:Uncharacterized protein n=1 Tax=Trametes sanguinea TaxID=158606 RepID=A0ACC1N4J6_9APHY|nr:hypothetical protein NUW54_g11927 [Trametes sanguinea]
MRAVSLAVPSPASLLPACSPADPPALCASTQSACRINSLLPRLIPLPGPCSADPTPSSTGQRMRPGPGPALSAVVLHPVPPPAYGSAALSYRPSVASIFAGYDTAVPAGHWEVSELVLGGGGAQRVRDRFRLRPWRWKLLSYLPESVRLFVVRKSPSPIRPG